MNKIEELKLNLLNARKEKDKSLTLLLSTIVGECSAIGKSAGNRESTDAEVLQVLKKFEKNQLENVQIYAKVGDVERRIQAETEIAIIRQFLPAKLSDAQVLDDIKFLIGANGLALEQKSLGIITKSLKEKYGDQFDGQQVSTVFKGLLS